MTSLEQRRAPLSLPSRKPFAGARSTTPSDAGSTAAHSATWEGATPPPVSSSTHSADSESQQQFTDQKKKEIAYLRIESSVLPLRHFATDVDTTEPQK
ncbi:hypothetical protein OUZ56_028479 [Daphnia magna]|uniref:Uncharacterized protein n=1 Tax=Daphnia magna TaxID=35525 RepID=A0ABR0B3Z2_9CRUS|nr:hypothetical protein OUZ56_028479 [Daphnia magna]